MRSLVLFDTNFGNTKKIAEAIAGALGKASKAVSVAGFDIKELEGIELLVVGGPIIGWKPSENMLKFLDSLTRDQLQGVRAAAFDTRVKIVLLHGDAAKKIARKLKAAGAKIVARSQAFLVQGREGPLFPGEIEKAVEWAKVLARNS